MIDKTTRKTAGWTLALATLVATAPFALGANVATNGSFENGPAFTSHFITLGAGSTAITGWTVVSGNVDYIGSLWAAADGGRSIDMNGNAVGAVAQTLATTAGVTYTVTFALAGNPDGTVKTMSVSAAGDVASYAFDTAGHGVGNLGWRDETFTFVATGATTTLTFQSTTFDPCRCRGPVLDHVRVEAAVLALDVDVKPGSEENPVNTRSKGVVPVAVLTTEDFDASTLDVATLAFGPGGAREAHGHGHLEDVDGDGDLDLMLHFRTQETGLAAGDDEACLTGATLSGQPVNGCDAVRVR